MTIPADAARAEWTLTSDDEQHQPVMHLLSEHGTAVWAKESTGYDKAMKSREK
ncbi:MAG: hypothetical protein KDD69_16910 [Bdellovibrionales bacterium]|nr:hypothetical protein [Bdellovibrionales bacterium]